MCAAPQFQDKRAHIAVRGGCKDCPCTSEFSSHHFGVFIYSLSFLTPRGLARNNRMISSSTRAKTYPASKSCARSDAATVRRQAGTCNCACGHRARPKLQQMSMHCTSTAHRGGGGGEGIRRAMAMVQKRDQEAHLPRSVPVERDEKCAEPAPEDGSSGAEGSMGYCTIRVAKVTG
jgi:hypothetical protein